MKTNNGQPTLMRRIYEASRPDPSWTPLQTVLLSCAFSALFLGLLLLEAFIGQM